MKVIGIFGLNLSEKSGGAYRLFEGLMQNAAYSNNKYLYITGKTSIETFPSNVKMILRPKLYQLLAQGLPRIPMISSIYRNENISKCLIKTLAGNKVSQVNAWLWPHCFRVIPNLKNIGVICHDMIHKHYPVYFNGRELSRRAEGEKSLKHTDAILCPSDNTRRDLLNFYPDLGFKTRVFPETACEILPENECADEIKAIESKFNGVPIFLFVGVDWPHKNHELLVAAAQKLLNMTNKKFKMIFLGNRRTSRICDIIKEKQMCDYIIDVGAVSTRELAAYYYTSRALLFPSLCEGFGIPLVEAMYYKLPIVASNHSCIPEICGDAAILLSPDNPDLWAKYMCAFLDGDIQHAKYSQLSHLRSSEFTWKKTWNTLDGVFEELFV